MVATDLERREWLPVFPAIFAQLAISATPSSSSPIFPEYPARAPPSCQSPEGRWDAGPIFSGGRGQRALPLKSWFRF